MFSRLPTLFITFILLLVIVRVEAKTRRSRETPKYIAVSIPDYLDRWDFTTEFNNLCTGIFPDDGESSSPILKETSAEAAKMNRFQAQLQSRASIPGSKKMKLTGTLFTVSCLYRYPDGENHQLGSYIAEQLGGRTIDIDNELAHLERKNKNKNGSGKARR
ncbi:hypothetical protein I203_105448 [Kwoniella mangroviensis CBS 8507]|uniref:uncharacterized protein n=1 Tax=Kwoniella mangroviensis CBS 8507 TaxID=1296122 RepID=UPI00080D037A|nr:uncharacterized protein I203_01261 [Kwoniella mangroviensis CBS 8507]OCF69404.1 hypothetical protein I203_01261 [Kwoniella mangroviensis CBS 8507]